MIVLAGRVTTPVPNRPYIFTGVPVSRVATVLPGVPHVKAQLPEPPKVRAKLPVAPHYRTRRPPTKNRLVAGNTTTVSGSAVVHARLGVEFAEQSVQVDQAGKLAVGVAAVSAVGVSGSALVRGLYRVDASNAVGVAGSGAARARHTLAASQAITTATDGGDARALYSLPAAQNIVVVQPVESRPFIDVAATQDVGVVSAGSSVPSVGTVNADASQDVGVDSAAMVRVRHSVEATQSITSGQSTVLDGLRVPLAAAQAVNVAGAGEARARYTLNAAQTVTTSPAATPIPAIAAANTTAVDAAGTARARHTITAATTTAVSGAATVEERTLARQKMGKNTPQNFSGTMPVQFTGGWTSDVTYPATVVGDALQVVGSGPANINVVMVGGTGNANLTVEIRVNGVAQTPAGTATASGGSFTVPSVALGGGDLITLWVTARTSTQRNITSATVEVVPL